MVDRQCVKEKRWLANSTALNFVLQLAHQLDGCVCLPSFYLRFVSYVWIGWSKHSISTLFECIISVLFVCSKVQSDHASLVLVWWTSYFCSAKLVQKWFWHGCIVEWGIDVTGTVTWTHSLVNPRVENCFYFVMLVYLGAVLVIKKFPAAERIKCFRHCRSYASEKDPKCEGRYPDTLDLITKKDGVSSVFDKLKQETTNRC